MAEDELIVQGKVVDSINEYNVAVALERLGYDFKFQYWVGPPYLRGSQLIDFVVYAPPRQVPLQVYGRYWHSGEKGREDAFNQAALKRMAPWLAPVVIIWEEECETVEQALSNLQGLI